jgi:hypothetical protein
MPSDIDLDTYEGSDFQGGNERPFEGKILGMNSAIGTAFIPGLEVMIA